MVVYNNVRQRPPDSADVVVVGAGIAGASTAYHLAQSGVDAVAIVEQEPVAGTHASGRNAAMAYQVIAEPEVMDLATEGIKFLRNPPDAFQVPMDHRWTGSITLAGDEHGERLIAMAERLQAASVAVEFFDHKQVADRVHIQRTDRFTHALYCPTDGVMDIHAMLQGYLKGARRAGHTVHFRCPAIELMARNNRITGVKTPYGSIRTDTVVLAAGPWSNALALTAGLEPLPLSIRRRHLLCLDTGRPVPAQWPFVWDITRNYYFRPEGRWLLFSPCDQEEAIPHDSGVDWETVENGADKALKHLTGVSSAYVANAWSGLRTLTPDGRFVLGSDPRVSGLLWVTGLCGHGMTTSAPVGRIAAEVVVHGEAQSCDLKPFLPARFLK